MTETRLNQETGETRGAAQTWRSRLESGILILVLLPLIVASCSPINRLGSLPAAVQRETGEVAPEGAEAEPVRQQMQRRLRPPFSDPFGQNGLFFDIGDFPIPPEEGRKPYPVKTVLVTGRTASSISLRWHDRSSAEDSTLLRRRADGSAGWEEAFTYGPVSGFNDVTDEGLDPDRRYCYQLVASNEHGSSHSPQRCAYTEGATRLPVYRAQLRVKTADISNAGTNNKVRVRLNSPPGGLTVPTGNVTVMDYGQNDFERDDDFFYDLELSEIDSFTDVTLISLSKEGSDGLCIKSFELWLNNSRVFDKDFSNRPDGCHWLDNDSGHSRTHTIFRDSLRAHPDWQSFAPTLQLSIDRDEIESRVEGMVGHLFSSIDKAEWGNRKDRAWVEASYRNAETVRIDLNMEGEVSWWFSPDIDIDFDVSFRFTETRGQWKFEITASNLEATSNFDWFTKTMSFILPCGPVASIALDEGIPDCISYLEDYIEERIRDGWQPISENFAIDNPCLIGFRPTATVTEFPNVEFSCVEDEGPGLPNVLVLRGATVVSQPID